MPVLNLRITNQSETISLNGNILAQDLVLHQAMITFPNTTALPSAVDIELPFITRFQIHNSDGGNAFLTIPVDVEKRTTISYPDLVFKTENIPSEFIAKVFESDGVTPCSAFSELQLWFNYKQSALF